MATNRELAKRSLAEYANLARSGQPFVSYAEIATLIGREGQHALLGGPLDALRDLCLSMQIPDVATMVVSKDSLRSGSLKPSPKALEKYGGWPELRKMQARCLTFDWGAFYEEHFG
jgi:hypothetical protein